MSGFSCSKRDGCWRYQRYYTDPETHKRKRFQINCGKLNLKSHEILPYKQKLDAEFIKNVYSKDKPLSVCVKKYTQIKEKEVFQGRRSQKSLRSDKYRLTIFRQFIEKHYGDIGIAKIKSKHLEFWKETCFDNGNSPTTIAINFRTVSPFFTHFKKAGLIERNPFDGIDTPKAEKKESEDTLDFYEYLRSFLEMELSIRKNSQSARYKKRPDNKKEKLEWFYDNDWLVHYLWIIMNTGTRNGEVSILKWQKAKDDVGTNHSRSYVYLSDDKTKFVIYFKGRRRTLPILPTVKNSIDAIDRYKKDGTTLKTYVFENKQSGYHYTTDTIAKLFKKLLKGLMLKDPMLKDLKYDKKYTPHSMRHGYGSSLVSKGADIYKVSLILGHGSVQVTEKIYLHLRSADISDTMNLI